MSNFLQLDLQYQYKLYNALVERLKEMESKIQTIMDDKESTDSEKKVLNFHYVLVSTELEKVSRVINILSGIAKKENLDIENFEVIDAISKSDIQLYALKGDKTLEYADADYMAKVESILTSNSTPESMINDLTTLQDGKATN